MGILKEKINRNDICQCGSGLKYKKCCLINSKSPIIDKNKLTISEILSFLKTGLENLNSVDSEVKNVNVKKIDILNNNILECQFYSKHENSIDIKAEISSIMGALFSFFTGDFFDNIDFSNYAVRAFNDDNIELMYIISSKEAAKSISLGKSIEWLNSSIIQENTQDYRLGIAKKQISEIENSLREVIVDVLSKRHGFDWFDIAVGRRLKESVIGTYRNQFGEEIKYGEILIKYTFILQLKKIICTNWKDFSDLFDNKIKFEEVILELNLIRREEAHNRDISPNDLERLNVIYEFLLVGITEKYANILPSYLLDNWRNKTKEIISKEPNLPYSKDKISSEKNTNLKLIMNITNIAKLVSFLEDKEHKLKSVVVPLEKKKKHNDLINIINNYRILHEELIESIKLGVLSKIENKQKELELHGNKFVRFTEKILLEGI